MYAVIKTGGKQYKVKEGDVIDVELLNIGEGEPVEFSDVLLLCDENKTEIGKPNIDGCVVVGEFLGESAGPKINALKYKRRHNDYRRWGHRQKYTRVKITGIQKGKE